MVKLELNGEERIFPRPLTVADLLRELGINTPAVAVEVNRTVVPKSSHPTRRLEEGDRVEIVTFVGGG